MFTCRILQKERFTLVLLVELGADKRAEHSDAPKYERSVDHSVHGTDSSLPQASVSPDSSSTDRPVKVVIRVPERSSRITANCVDKPHSHEVERVLHSCLPKLGGVNQ